MQSQNTTRPYTKQIYKSPLFSRPEEVENISVENRIFLALARFSESEEHQVFEDCAASIQDNFSELIYIYEEEEESLIYSKALILNLEEFKQAVGHERFTFVEKALKFLPINAYLCYIFAANAAHFINIDFSSKLD